MVTWSRQSKMLKELKLSLVSFLLGIIVNYSLPLNYTSLVTNIDNDIGLYLSSQDLSVPILIKIVEIFLLFTVANQNILNW